GVPKDSSLRLSVGLSWADVKRKMENPVKTLRMAYGKTQQDFAQMLGCGYSTLQGYEAGRAIPPAIRDKLVSLALERRLGDLAADLKQEVRQGEAEELETLRQEAHLIVDAVFSAGDPALIDGLRAVIRMCDKYLSKRRR